MYNNDNDNINYKINKKNSNDKEMNCVNSDNSTTNNGQWNKACMCTGPEVNGSWIPCNNANKLAFFNHLVTMLCVFALFFVLTVIM